MRAARSRRWPLRAALSVAASEARAERTWRARQRRHSPRPRGGCQCAPLMGAISLARDLTRLGASGGLEARALRICGLNFGQTCFVFMVHFWGKRWNNCWKLIVLRLTKSGIEYVILAGSSLFPSSEAKSRF